MEKFVRVSTSSIDGYTAASIAVLVSTIKESPVGVHKTKFLRKTL